MAEYTQTYWNELIDKYRKGTLSSRERFELEKKALDDPFLFDALEGFALYDKEMEAEEPSSNSARIFTLPRIAAVASIAILIAVFFTVLPDYFMPDSGSQGQIAMVDEEEPTEETRNSKASKDNEQGVEPPSTAPHGDENPPKEEKAISDERNTKKAREAYSSVTPETETNSTSEAIKEDEQTAIAPARGDKKPKNPEAIASLDDSSKNTDRIGLTEIDNTLTRSKEIANASDATMIPDADSASPQSTIVPVNNGLREEVTSEENDKKKKKTTFYYEAVPVIGKKIFDEYAKERIDKRGLRQEKAQEVTIEFTIDANGNLSNFQHIFSGCSECGPFAISLLQRSGEWETVPPGYSGKARYTFIF